MTLAIALATLLPALLFQLMPLAQGPFLFTVRVPAGFAESETGRGLVRRFRTLVWLAGGVSAAAMGWGLSHGQPWWALSIPLLNAGAMIAAQLDARRRTLRYAAPPGGTLRRAALLANDEDGEPWWLWGSPVVALALTVTGAVMVWVLAEAIPDPMPVHWGISGRPDRWAPKTPPRLFAAFPIALATQALLGFILYALGRSGGPSPRRTANLRMTAALNVWTAGLLTVVAMAPLRGASGMPGGPWATVLVVSMIAPMVWLAIKLQRAETGEAEPTRDDCWKGGMIYVDPEDSRMMVPNRLGAGYGFNMGHPVARVVFPALMALTLATALAPVLLV